MPMKTVAKALVFDSEDNALILYRSASHPRFAHDADLPGGEVEQDEDGALAVQREIQEETGLTVDLSSVLFAKDITADGGRKHILFTVHLTAPEPSITLSWEHESYAWISKKDLANATNAVDPYMQIAHSYVTEN